MSSIIRPTPRQRTRRLLVLVAAVFAIMVPIAQNLAGWGLSQAEFAADGDSTLRVAGYAFSIWGLIYLGILAYAIRLILPQESKDSKDSKESQESTEALAEGQQAPGGSGTRSSAA